MIFIIFIFGLIVGSFLNAVIYRLYVGKTILMDRSICPFCKHELAAVDLVPLFSFIALRGRCRYCSKNISWQYPLIEFVTGLSFVFLAQNFQYSISNIQFLFQLVFVSFLILIAVYDYKHYLILDKVVFPAFALVIIYNIYLGDGRLLAGLWASLLVSGFFAAQYYISRGRWIGFGDVKLGLFLGSLFGIKLSIVMLILAYFIGAVIGVGLILQKRKHFDSKLPLGVFLSISAIINLIYGSKIAEWYFKLIGL